MTPSFHARLVVDAPPEEVFAALSTLDGLAAWWTPEVTGVPRRGHELTFWFGDERIVMAVEESDPPNRVAWRCVRHTKFPEWDGTGLSFDLHPKDGSTAVAFEHAGLEAGLSCFPVCSAGWEHYLASLTAYVVSGRGIPWGSPAWRPAGAER